MQIKMNLQVCTLLLLTVLTSNINGDKQAKQGRGRGSIWWWVFRPRKTANLHYMRRRVSYCLVISRKTSAATSDKWSQTSPNQRVKISFYEPKTNICLCGRCCAENWNLLCEMNFWQFSREEKWDVCRWWDGKTAMHLSGKKRREKCDSQRLLYHYVSLLHVLLC